MLFDPTTLAGLPLQNRLVMAPMTRNRAVENNAPNSLVAEYYAQRASAGLIVTEGTSPSPNGLGYPRIPGIFGDHQVQAWRPVTEAVHAKGARIFLQLMHTGRVGHRLNLPDGAEVVGPTGERCPGEIYTDQKGRLPHTTPRAMTAADIERAVAEFAAAARNAIEAGFDGVELHGANGYLIEQFLHANVNKRTDGYGATAAGRNRFALEVARAAVVAVGKEKVGMRLSPYGAFNATGPFVGVDIQFEELARALGTVGLAYLHLVDHSSMGAPKVPDEIKMAIRRAFPGTLILSGGYDRERAEADLEARRGDLIAFGRPFLANPDLVARLQRGSGLNEPDMTTFYTPGPKGYTDYPAVA